jgi:hypothetical protein
VRAYIVCSALPNGFRCGTRQQLSCSDQVAGRCFRPKHGLAVVLLFAYIALPGHWRTIRHRDPIYISLLSGGTRRCRHRQQYTATRSMPLRCASGGTTTLKWLASFCSHRVPSYSVARIWPDLLPTQKHKTLWSSHDNAPRLPVTRSTLVRYFSAKLLTMVFLAHAHH